MQQSTITVAPSRRTDLDILRLGAFAVLIVYHVGMLYVPWDWHVKSDYVTPAVIPFMTLSAPWRLCLLFWVSGAAVRIMVERKGGLGMFTDRMVRLWPPLLFGMFVVVAPQSYFQIVEALHQHFPGLVAHQSPYLQNFWVKYATASGGWCDPTGDCLRTPTWNHLWFVAYLIVYSAVLALILLLTNGGRGMTAAVEAWGARWQTSASLLAAVIAANLILQPMFPVTHDLINDWYNHAVSFTFFMSGYFLCMSRPWLETLHRRRGRLLLIGIITWPPFAWYMVKANDGFAGVPAWVHQAMHVDYALNQVAVVGALIGFAQSLKQRSLPPSVRYLCGGIFAFYIIHQTAIICAQEGLRTFQLPAFAEAAFIGVLTLLACLAFYDTGRRLGPLGLLFGVSSTHRVGAKYESDS